MNLKEIHSAYFVGIGGIGMSALARHFLACNISVSGYDKTRTPLTDALVAEGCSITFSNDINTLNKEVDVVVYTPAIPKDHIQFNFYKDNNYTLLKRSDVLQIITQDVFTIAVGGSHGKTTTSSMIAHLLHNFGKGCTAFLGGISSNLQSNYCNSNPDVIVIEADEYDRSFHKLNPDVAIITSIDADHLDIYGTHENVIEAYFQFACKVKSSGTLLAHTRTGFKDRVVPATNLSYALNDKKADAHAVFNHVGNRVYDFNHSYLGKEIENVLLKVPGIHNVENMTAAIAVAEMMEMSEEEIKEGVADFKGIKRRFEYLVDTPQIVYVDDYAHHPSEIQNFVNSLKLQYPDRKITVIFQPHLFTRTRDFVDGFAESLSLADEVVLLDIYPARELPIEGVTSQIIYDLLTCENKVMMNKSEVVKYLDLKEVEVLATIGAGDIDTLVVPIQHGLIQKYKL